MKMFGIVVSVFCASTALGQPTKQLVGEELRVDLSERIQYSRNSMNEIFFEYCKLSICEKLNSKTLRFDSFPQKSKPKGLSTGLALQLFTYAANEKKDLEDFVVGGVFIGDPVSKRIICKGIDLREALSKAAAAKEFTFKYKDLKCYGRNSVDKPIEREAQNLRKVLNNSLNKYD